MMIVTETPNEIRKFLQEGDLAGAINFANGSLKRKKDLIGIMMFEYLVDLLYIENSTELVWLSHLDEPCLDRIIQTMAKISKVRFPFPYSYTVCELERRGKLQLKLSERAMDILMKSNVHLFFVFFYLLGYNQNMNSIFTKKRIITFALLVVLFYIINAFLGVQIRNFVYVKSESLQAFLWKSGGEAAFERKNQAELNKKLTEENQKLLSDLADLEKARAENDSLREALGLGLNKDFELIMGEATAKDVINDSLLINVGSKTGVMKGFPVVLSSKVLLGKVIDVYPDYSRVLLVSSKDNLIDVEMPDSQGFALSRGLGAMKVMLDMFPKDKQLNEGSLILTSAMGGNYPSGLVIGKVKNVQKSDSDAFQKADIELSFDLSTISKVFVIRNAQIVVQ